MAGVAGPMLRYERSAAVRLLTGLMMGELAAGMLLAVPAYLLGQAAHAALPGEARLWLVVGACVIFGVADLANRTPHTWRQVPQRLIWQLGPGRRGLAWGFDLGLLVTTQKVVSLIWVAVIASVLLDPAGAAVLMLWLALLSWLTVVAASLRRPATGPRRPLAPVWRRVRFGSGAVMVILGAVTAIGAWPG